VLQRAKPATKREMSQFHSDEYVEFLQRITPENMNQFTKEQMKCQSSPRFVCGEVIERLTGDRSCARLFRQRRR
jgi:acetoin utilization deacetylase AcuC-like enzyme